MTVVLQNDRVRAEVDPRRGARLISLHLDGHQVLGHADPDADSGESISSGCFPGLEMTLSWHGAPDGWCSLGFHPWFRRRLDTGGPVVLDVDPLAMVERGPDHLPTGAIVEPAVGPWDDCFQLAAPPRLTWPDALSLQLRSDTEWWVVFDESREAVCVEPQTAPPDAIHHERLRPPRWQRSVSLLITVRDRPLPAPGPEH